MHVWYLVGVFGYGSKVIEPPKWKKSINDLCDLQLFVFGVETKTAKQRNSFCLKHNVWTARFHRGFWSCGLRPSAIRSAQRISTATRFTGGSGWPWCTVFFVTIPQDTPPASFVSSRVPSRTKTSGALHVCIYWLFIIYGLFSILLMIIFIITITIFYLLLISCLFIICYKIYKLFAIYYLLWNAHYLSFVISCSLVFMIYWFLLFVYTFIHLFICYLFIYTIFTCLIVITKPTIHPMFQSKN